MNNLKKRQSGIKEKMAAKFAVGLGGLVVVAGLVVILGWYTHTVSLIQVLPSFPPMQYNTALGFVLSGLGLIFFSQGKRNKVAGFLGFVVLVWGALVLWEYVSGMNLGVDELFIKAYVFTKVSSPGRMAPNTAFCFCLTGFILWLHGFARQEWKLTWIYYLSLFLLANAISALAGYVFHLEASYGWGSLTRMALSTAMAFLALGVGFIFSAWNKQKTHWFSAVIFIFGILIAMQMLQMLTKSEDDKSRLSFYRDAQTSAQAVQREFKETEAVLNGLRAFYENSKLVERGEFRNFSKQFFSRDEILQGLDWMPRVVSAEKEKFESQIRLEGFPDFMIKEGIDAEDFKPAQERSEYYPVTYTEPFEKNKTALGFDSGSDPVRLEALLRAERSDQAVATPPIHLFRETGKGREGIIIFYPVFETEGSTGRSEIKGSARGFLAAVIRVASLVEVAVNSLPNSEELLFSIRDVTSGQAEVIFESASFLNSSEVGGLANMGYSDTASFNFAGRNYEMVIIPAKTYLSAHPSWFPWIAFVLILLFVLTTSGFLSKSIDSSQYLSQINKELKYQKLALDQFAIVAETDPQGRITYVNDQFCAVSQYSREELLGQDHRLINSGYHPKSFFKEMWATIGNGKVWRGEVKNRAKDGTTYWVDATIVPFLDNHGRPEKYLAIRSLITDRKEAEEEIRRASEAAFEASRAKSDFLATMSHEIRTPMNAILGMAELLAETKLTEEQQQYVLTLSRGGETLLSLINNVLDLSKIESGVIDIENTDYSIREIVERTVEVLAISAHRKGIELSVSVSVDVPEKVSGDPSRVRQVLMNLIGNAIKFTEKGEVAVELSKDNEELKVSVRDTGIGLLPEQIHKLFLPFTQADSSTTRKYGGTGLGLSISKRLVELMGGEIGVESKIGVGSHFYFTLPLCALVGSSLEETTGQNEESEILKGKKVLIVDDNATNRLIIRKAVLSWGMIPSEVSNGIDCVQLVKQKAAEGFHYDLMILDCRMPDMGGFDVAKKLKEDDSLKLPMIIMLTSDSRTGDIETARKLGFEAYVVKPIRRSELLKVVTGVFLKNDPSSEAVGREPKKDSGHTRIRKILLAEDAEDNQVLMKAYLRGLPYELDIAQNGKIAVEKAAIGQHDLILMDVQMPEMDGYTATQLIRAQNKNDIDGKRIKIIALTANALKRDEKRCFAAGCDAYLVKPIKKAALLKVLAEYFNPQKGERGSEKNIGG